MPKLLVRPAFEIDTDAPLRPQLLKARAAHVPWKLIAASLGVSISYLEKIAAGDRPEPRLCGTTRTENGGKIC